MSCEINFKETALQSRSQRPNSGNHSAPPSPPLTETPDAHAVSGSLNISILEARVLVTSSCLSLQWLCTNSQSGYGNLLNQIFWLFLSCPNATFGVWLVLQQHLACSQHSSLVQCVWPVHCGGFPCQINIARVIHWHHPFSQLGPGKVPTITLYLWYS